MTSDTSAGHRAAAVAAAAAALLLAPAVAAAQGAAGTDAPPGGDALPGAAETITAPELERHVRALADDSMRGRDTPSPELVEAARYVADRLRESGVRPAVSDSFLQWYPVTTVLPGRPGAQRALLRGPDGERDLELGAEFVPLGVGPRAHARGPLRVVRSLVRPKPAEGRVLAVPSAPKELRSSLRKVRSAVDASGAAGAVVVVDAGEDLFRRLASFFGGERTKLGRPDTLSTPVVLARRGALPAALRRALSSGRAVPSGWSAELRSTSVLRTRRAPNTLGWIRGGDPALRDEYVLFASHMDHVGVGPAVDGDSVYNGADDDGSGTAALLEIAEAFGRAEEPPRRSVVFLALSGEEKGLLGSRWYVREPPFPLERTVAVLNMDMIGRGWRDTVAAVGMEHSSLGRTVRDVADIHSSRLGLTVVGDRWPGERLFFRSDHYTFAREGVPALFFFSGLHEDYHEPSDEADALLYPKTARIVRLVYLTGLRVAWAREAPTWYPSSRRRIVGGGR